MRHPQLPDPWWAHTTASDDTVSSTLAPILPPVSLHPCTALPPRPPHPFPQAASDIVSSQGWRGLYRGNLLNVMRSAPQKALDFFAFDAFKRLLGDDSHSKTFLAAGAAPGQPPYVTHGWPLKIPRQQHAP